VRNESVGAVSILNVVAFSDSFSLYRRPIMRIRILVTGGTFDKEYDELTGRLYFKDTHVPEMLVRGRCRLDVTVETVMMIDSLDLDDNGRAMIVRRCRDCPEHAIVVTHGTDTMVETSRALAAAALHTKTIVLTGAMVPYAFGSSDGLFNLGSALSFVQVVPSGVYVAMNGQHFNWDRVRKNRETGVFEGFAPDETTEFTERTGSRNGATEGTEGNEADTSQR
jgi:L-asparaginase